MKEEYIEIAIETLQDYNIKITTYRRQRQGAVIGSNENKKEFVLAKVSECKATKNSNPSLISFMD